MASAEGSGIASLPPLLNAFAVVLLTTSEMDAVLQSRSLRALCGVIGRDGPITVAVDTCSDINACLATVGVNHRD